MSKNVFSFSSTKLVEELRKVKKALVNGKSCEKSFKEFSNRKVLKDRDNYFKSFFKPLTKKYGLGKCKSGKERKSRIKELWKKKKKDDELMGYIHNISEWYFLDKDESDNLDFKRFRDFVYYTDLMQKTHVPIKLILTKTSQEMNIAQGFYCKYKTEFGATHAALQVGPYIIDWNNGEIIIPRPLRIRKPIMVLDLPSNSPCTKSFFKKVTDIIWEWNTLFSYDLLLAKFAKIKSSKKSNCHGFVKYFCRTMTKAGFKIDLKWYSDNGEIADFFETIKRFDKNNRKKKKVEVKLKVFRNFDFKSHKDLHKKIPKILGCHLHEYKADTQEKKEKLQLLRSFDKAFWYGKHENKNDCYDYKKCPLLFNKKGMFSVTRAVDETKKTKEETKKKVEQDEKENEELKEDYGILFNNFEDQNM